MKKLFLLSSLLFFFGASAPHWEKWNPDVFTRAAKEKKLVLLDMEAVWCHWCHVMDQQTYADPEVIKLLDSKFIVVKVDQDSQPDLSNRYEDWGWPATVLFNSKGQEIAKRAGFIPTKGMVAMLKAFIADPTPGPSISKIANVKEASSSVLPKKLVKSLEDLHKVLYDSKNKGFGTFHKYMQLAPVEWSLVKASEGNKEEEKRAKESLDVALQLIDPAWGGAYQYSANEGAWDAPHYEKIIETQRNNLIAYSLGYSYFQDKKYLDAALQIKKYLQSFLQSPEGAFYTSQDADLKDGEHAEAYFKLSDTERRKLGIPRVDKNIYSKENGWVIEALCVLYENSGNEDALAQAKRAADWIIKNRMNSDGSFKHGENKNQGPYLADNLSMMGALMELYRATAERHWLDQAGKTAKYISATFVLPKTAGFVTTLKDGTMLAPTANRDENVDLARVANLLYRYTKDAAYKNMSEKAMKFLANPKIAELQSSAGILLANQEQSTEPLHLTVVGAKDDSAAQKIFSSLVSYPTYYKKVEWWDRKEGPLPASTVDYPQLKTAAAFVCTESRCSLPLMDVLTLHSRIQKLESGK